MPELPELREPECLDHWRHKPGLVPVWVRGVVLLACAVTIAAACLGPRLLWPLSHAGSHRIPFWFRDGLALATALALVLAALPGGEVSRFVRVAVWLPIVHVAVFAVTWCASGALAGGMLESVRGSEVATRLSPSETFGAAAALVVGVTALVTRGRRRGELVHGVVMTSLVALLGLGLWLPIVTHLWGSSVHDVWSVQMFADLIAHPVRFVALVLGPPLAVAALFTRRALRQPGSLARWRGVGIVGIGMVWAGAIVSFDGRSDGADYAYAAFVVPLLALAALTVGSLVVLGATIWLHGRRARRALASDRGPLAGTLAPMDGDDDGDPAIGRVEITSWLRGPAAVVRELVLVTPRGAVPVPGARLVAPLAAATTQLYTGEAIPVLRAGDRVVLAGLEFADAEHPFRTSALPVAGTRELYIAREDEARYGVANVALALWRPCVAYLVILVVVGLPTLLAAMVIR